jgi:hypothetical protein
MISFFLTSCSNAIMAGFPIAQDYNCGAGGVIAWLCRGNKTYRPGSTKGKK